MTKYVISEFFSSDGATLYKNPSDQTVLYILFFRPALAVATLLLLLLLSSLIMYIPRVLSSSTVVVVQDPSVQVAVLVIVLPAPFTKNSNNNFFVKIISHPSPEGPLIALHSGPENLKKSRQKKN